MSGNINKKIKSKGFFEINKVVGSEPAYHKDNSFRVIPLALQEYFVNNIPVEKTIYNHTNIYDFCGRQKFKGQDYGIIKFCSFFLIKVLPLGLFAVVLIL